MSKHWIGGAMTFLLIWTYCLQPPLSTPLLGGGMTNGFSEILKRNLSNIKAWEKSQLQRVTIILGEQKAYAGLACISDIWDLELSINVGVPCNMI